MNYHYVTMTVSFFIVIFGSLLFYHVSNYKYRLELELDSKIASNTELIDSEDIIENKNINIEKEEKSSHDALKPKKKMVIFSTVPSQI